MNRLSLSLAPVLTLALSTLAVAADAAQDDKVLSAKPGPEQLITSITTLLVFLLLVFILAKFAWKPILAGLKGREDKIRKDIADAEEARKNAEATLREYTEQLRNAESRIRDTLAKAQADGEKLATTIRMQAQQEAEEIKEKAQREIEGTKNLALQEIYDKAADLSTSIAEKIIRRNLNAQDQQEIVRASLAEFQSVSKN
jgi:F-type H+-transporting ATPase subunit b